MHLINHVKNVVEWRTRFLIMSQQYVEKRDGGYWITGTRVSLDSIVYDFIDGMSPDTIAENFPVLTLEEVYGAIAFYLANRAEVDAYLRETDAQFESFQNRIRTEYPRLHKKIEELQQQTQTVKS
jgi:uncharacterized protein (DUF433 family)